MFYIYFLYSIGSDKYYVGHSDDVERRLLEHNEGQHITYTSKHRPWELYYYFQVSDQRGDALKIERYIKKQKCRRFIEKIIREKFTLKDFETVLY